MSQVRIFFVNKDGFTEMHRANTSTFRFEGDVLYFNSMSVGCPQTVTITQPGFYIHSVPEGTMKDWVADRIADCLDTYPSIDTERVRLAMTAYWSNPDKVLGYAGMTAFWTRECTIERYPR